MCLAISSEQVDAQNRQKNEQDVEWYALLCTIYSQLEPKNDTQNQPDIVNLIVKSTVSEVMLKTHRDDYNECATGNSTTLRINEL